MVVLIDTNVIIDFIIKRQPFEKESTEVMKKCASREIQGYVAFHSISNLWYILRKMPENERREWLVNVCKCLTVVGADHDEVINAIKKSNFKDFEDCLQDKCAVGVNANYIITRNVDDFAGSEIPAILPEDFLKIENV